MNIDNNFRSEKVEKLIEKMNIYLGSDVESVPLYALKEMKDLDSDIGNEVMLLRDNGVLDIRSDDGQLFLEPNGRSGHILTGYQDGYDPKLEGELILEDELTDIAERIDRGFSQDELITVDEMEDLCDGESFYQELNILSGLGYIEPVMEETELKYRLKGDLQGEEFLDPKYRDLPEKIRSSIEISEEDDLERHTSRRDWYRRNPWKPLDDREFSNF